MDKKDIDGEEEEETIKDTTRMSFLERKGEVWGSLWAILSRMGWSRGEITLE